MISQCAELLSHALFPLVHLVDLQALRSTTHALRAAVDTAPPAVWLKAARSASRCRAAGLQAAVKAAEPDLYAGCLCRPSIPYVRPLLQVSFRIRQTSWLAYTPGSDLAGQQPAVCYVQDMSTARSLRPTSTLKVAI